MEWDLNQGMEHVIRKDQSFSKDEGLSMILKWILENKQAFAIMDPKTNETAPLTSLSTDFVCFRGLCTTIMCTPYEKREGWQLFAVKHKGTIYLRQMDTEAKIKAEANKPEHQLKMSSWGYKFEQFVLKDLKKERDESFDIESGRKLPPVNENEEFCSVFRTRLGHHSMVYGAEMDGFRMKTPSEGPLNPDDIDLNQDGHFIELKTNRIIDSPRLESRYKNPRNFLFGFRSTTIRSENQNSKHQTFLTVKILLLNTNEETNWGNWGIDFLKKSNSV